jgi:hypothetical protein
MEEESQWQMESMVVERRYAQTEAHGHGHHSPPTQAYVTFHTRVTCPRRACRPLAHFGARLDGVKAFGKDGVVCMDAWR